MSKIHICHDEENDFATTPALFIQNCVLDILKWDHLDDDYQFEIDTLHNTLIIFKKEVPSE